MRTAVVRSPPRPSLLFMKNAKTFIIAACVALVAGCMSLPKTRDVSACPFRLDYVVSMKAAGEFISVTVTHVIVNQSQADVTVCKLHESFGYDWNPNLDLPQAKPEPEEGVFEFHEAEIGGGLICGVFGMKTMRNQFAVVRPDQRLVLGPHSFDISTKTKALTYQAWIHPGRDGHQFNLHAWTGNIEGSSITIPVGIVKIDKLPEKKN